MKKINQITVLALAIFGFVTAQTVSAQTITCTQAYHATHNTHVHFLTTEDSGWGPVRDRNYSDNQHLYIHVWTWYGTPGIMRAFLNFDLPKTQADVNNVKLFLYNPHSYPNEINHASTFYEPLNKLVFNKITTYWDQTEVTWNQQPEIAEKPEVITKNIEGTLDNPSYENIIVNLNDLYLEDGKLMKDVHGVSCRYFQESIDSYYRRFGFASTRYPDSSFWPKLEVEYQIPAPRICFEKPNIFSICNENDLELIFPDVEYEWIINDIIYNGKKVFPVEAESYEVSLTIQIINSLMDVIEFQFEEKFENVGVGDLENEKFLLYPNPANNILNVECDANIKISHYKIFSINGALIREAAFTETGINISELPAGNYLLQLFDDTNEKRAFSFVKQ